MGISLLSCYHGAQIFEIYGLGKEVVDFCFFGSVSRIGGLSLAEVQLETESFWVKVSPPLLPPHRRFVTQSRRVTPNVLQYVIFGPACGIYK